MAASAPSQPSPSLHSDSTPVRVLQNEVGMPQMEADPSDSCMTIDIHDANRKFDSRGAAALKRLAADSDSPSNSDSTTSLPSTEPSTTPDAGSSSGGSSKNHKRLRVESSNLSQQQRKLPKHFQVAHPLGIKPLGNAFLSDRNDRATSLGLFAKFEDDFFLNFLSIFAHDPRTLAGLEAVSHGLYAFINATNSIWREAFLLAFNGKMKRWCGSWKRTFVWHYNMDRAVIDESSKETIDGAGFSLLAPPVQKVQSPYIFSDTLYHPFRLAMAPLEHLVAPECRFTPIAKIDLATTGSILEFKDKYAYANQPAILQNAMPIKDWPCRDWTLEALAQRWPNRFFQCEAVKSRLPTYFSYSRAMQHLQQQTWLSEEKERDVDSRCASGTPTDEGSLEKQGNLLKQPSVSQIGQHYFSAFSDDGDSTFDPYSVPDESPFYLFDATFAEDPHASLEWRVPRFFQQISATLLDATSNNDASAVRSDLFSLLGPLRPDNRWVIAGPARSGSGWHKDPNGTSAWNAVLNGRKAWMMLPPHVTPPGVYVSDDEAEVTAPLSIAEWLLDFADETRKLYGPKAARPEDRLLLEGVCEAGEVLYVPSGWWHLVVNLEESVALTQNFVSPAELGTVLDFMKNKPEQLSGFKKSQANGQASGPTLAPGRPAASVPNVARSNIASEDDECDDGAGFEVFDLFCERLGRFDKNLLQDGLTSVTELESKRAVPTGQISSHLPQKSKVSRSRNSSSWWETLKNSSDSLADNRNGEGLEAEAQQHSKGFSISFELDDTELEDVPW